MHNIYATARKKSTATFFLIVTKEIYAVLNMAIIAVACKEKHIFPRRIVADKSNGRSKAYDTNASNYDMAVDAAFHHFLLFFLLLLLLLQLCVDEKQSRSCREGQ